MLALQLHDIDNMLVPEMTVLITSYSKTNNVELATDCFTSTPFKLMRDHLLVNVLELHSYCTTSVLNESTPSSFVEGMNDIQAYNEYYLVFLSYALTFHDIIMIKPCDIKTKSFERQQNILLDLDASMNECLEPEIVTQSKQPDDVEIQYVHDENEQEKSINQQDNEPQHDQDTSVIVTVTEDTSDLEIDMMSYYNACDEIVRISTLQGRAVKLEDVRKKYGADVMKE